MRNGFVLAKTGFNAALNNSYTSFWLDFYRSFVDKSVWLDFKYVL